MTDHANAERITESIPVLDMGPYLAGETGARDSLAQEIRQIQENIGFLVMVNHGVDWALLGAAYAKLRAFFALPIEDKLELKIDESSLGYVPIRSTVYITSVLNKNSKKDLNETLILALDRPDDHPAVRERRRFHGPNRWPDKVPGFRQAMVRYQMAIKEMGFKLLPLYALALGKPADFFLPFFTDPIMWSRNAHYPPVTPEDNQFGIAPHSDHSFLTMLPLAEVAGLQVLTPSGDWAEPEPVDKGIVVNTGEFLNRWSNGRFIPTPHRVVPPDHDRYSIATFFSPSSETIAEPSDFFVNPDDSAKFEPVAMQRYVEDYIDTNYLRDAGGKQD